MADSRRRRDGDAVTPAPQVPVQDALGLHHRAERVAVFDQHGALVGRVVSRDVRRGAARRGMEPGPVLDRQVRPAHRRGRVRVQQCRSDRGPVIVVRFDERRGPSWRGERMILGEHDDRRARVPDAGRSCLGRRVEPCDAARAASPRTHRCTPADRVSRRATRTRARRDRGRPGRPGRPGCVARSRCAQAPARWRRATEMAAGAEVSVMAGGSLVDGRSGRSGRVVAVDRVVGPVDQVERVASLRSRRVARCQSTLGPRARRPGSRGRPQDPGSRAAARAPQRRSVRARCETTARATARAACEARTARDEQTRGCASRKTCGPALPPLDVPAPATGIGPRLRDQPSPITSI